MLAVEDERVRDLHPVPGGRELLPRIPAPRTPAAGATRRDGIRATSTCRRGGASERSEPSERALVVGPGLGRLARLHEQVHRGERDRDAEHDPDRSHVSTVPERSAGRGGQDERDARSSTAGTCSTTTGAGRSRGGPCVHHDELLGRGRDRASDGRADRDARPRRRALRRRTGGASSGSPASSPTATPSPISRTCTCWRRPRARPRARARAVHGRRRRRSRARSGSSTRATCIGCTPSSASSDRASARWSAGRRRTSADAGTERLPRALGVLHGSVRRSSRCSRARAIEIRSWASESRSRIVTVSSSSVCSSIVSANGVPISS